ncbi:hypothetical protein F4825DRAFT_473298 [Nemania diffusa]|nr:hypothetical protein F4825DRAFT_473298 [Nemania diffusa]
MTNRHNGASLSARSSTPDCGTHMHSAGFSHEPREGLVESTPGEDAGVGERALNDFYWKGRDLHSQRRYLALRLRFRQEPYGYLIAHDIHDAVKESRKRRRASEKGAKKHLAKSAIIPVLQASFPMPTYTQSQGIELSKDNPKEKKAKKEQEIYTNINRGRESSRPIEEDQIQETGTSRAKVKKKLAEIFTFSPRSSSSRTTTRPASPSIGEDPFQDPPLAPGKKKTKARKEKKRGKARASLESLDSVQDPFRDPEPMRLIDADDFRLESPLNTD